MKWIAYRILLTLCCAVLLLNFEQQSFAQTKQILIQEAATQTQTQKRMALVVGNSGYISVSKLANPGNDANLIASTLENVGFEVMLVLDADLAGLNKALTQFVRKLKNSDAVGLFYYAGHGVQMGGENFLIPVDANIQDETELSWQAIRVNDVMAMMKRQSTNINIIILDACRNNPFPAASRSTTRGLAKADAPQGTYIAYATGPGQVALDGEGDNSPYSLALAAAISTTGLTIEETFKSARQEVLDSTQGSQVPWEASSIIGMFHFTEPHQDDAANLNSKLQKQLALINSLRQSPLVAKEPEIQLTELETASGEQCTGLADASVDYSKLQAQAGNVIEACQRAVKSYPNNDQYKYQLARSYLAVGNKEVEAAHWMRKAAEAYFPAAMNGLGVLLNHGRGVAKDDEEAFKWVLRAAEKGNAPAMTNAGVAHQAALGTNLSNEKALLWFNKAIDNKDARAIVILASIYSGSNQLLTNSLVKSDFEIAEKLILDNDLQGELDVPRLFSHLYGDWPWKVIGSNVTSATQQKFWKKSRAWRLVGIERKDRISIVQGSSRDGYIKGIGNKLDAIERAGNIPHPVDRNGVEKLYFSHAYADNLYVVFDWNRDLLTNYSEFGNELPQKYHKRIDELRSLLFRSKRIIRRN